MRINQPGDNTCLIRMSRDAVRKLPRSTPKKCASNRRKRHVRKTLWSPRAGSRLDNIIPTRSPADDAAPFNSLPRVAIRMYSLSTLQTCRAVCIRLTDSEPSVVCGKVTQRIACRAQTNSWLSYQRLEVCLRGCVQRCHSHEEPSSIAFTMPNTELCDWM